MMSQFSQDEIRRRLSDISRREMMNITKEAIKESVSEHITKFGWWSLKTLSALIVGIVIYASIYFERFHK